MSRPHARRIVPTHTWHITHEEAVKMLTLLRVVAGRKGKQTPVANALLERLESVGV